MIKVYVARAMTGRIKEDVVREAKADKAYLEERGFTVLDPVTSEGVEETKEILLSTKNVMDVYWPRDKAMIREAHVVFNMSPHMPSLGAIREHGYSRYHLWKKTISVFPLGKKPAEGAIPYYEDDLVTDSLVEAADNALRTHGTLWKRLTWRLALYVRCLPKAVYHHLKEWK